MEQLSLFECLETIPESDMVKQIGDALGIEFKYRGDIWGWTYTKKNVTCSVHYSRYSFEPYERFIATSVDGKMGGSSGPMDSIEDAIRFMKSGMKNMGIF